ncbi:hypothetical protein GCM10017688_43140 [Streptomyces ramulosus]
MVNDRSRKGSKRALTEDSVHAGSRLGRTQYDDSHRNTEIIELRQLSYKLRGTRRPTPRPARRPMSGAAPSPLSPQPSGQVTAVVRRRVEAVPRAGVPT